MGVGLALMQTASLLCWKELHQSHLHARPCRHRVRIPHSYAYRRAWFDSLLCMEDSGCFQSPISSQAISKKLVLWDFASATLFVVDIILFHIHHDGARKLILQNITRQPYTPHVRSKCKVQDSTTPFCFTMSRRGCSRNADFTSLSLSHTKLFCSLNRIQSYQRSNFGIL